MRPLIWISLLALSVLLGTPSLAATRREVSCCLPIVLPGVAEEPRCTLVRLRLRPPWRTVAKRRVCRLAGGRPWRGGLCQCSGRVDAAVEGS